MSARIRLTLALEALDAQPTGLTADELKVIRESRAREMLNAAQELYETVTGKKLHTARVPL